MSENTGDDSPDAEARQKLKTWSTEGLSPKLDHNLIIYVPSGMLYCRKGFSRLGIPNLPLTPTGYTVSQKGRARLERDRIFEDHKKYHGGETAEDPRQKIRLIGSIIDEIMATRPKALGLRDATLIAYRVYFGKLKDYWGDKSLTVINQDSFDEWIEHSRKLTPCRKMNCPTQKDCKTAEHKPRARKCFFEYSKFMNILCGYAHQKKYTHYQLSFKNPDLVQKNTLQEKKRQGDNRGIDSLTPEEKEILTLQKARLLTRDEINRLWGCFNEDTRDQFACAFGCLMRKLEVLQAPWSEIDLVKGTWTLPPWRVKTGSKTGRGRSFYIAPWALERLRARHKAQKGSSRWVFPGWSRSTDVETDKPVGDNKSAWTGAKRRAGIGGKLRWHDIRHTALTFALLGDPDQSHEERQKGIRDAREVSEFAGVSEETIRRVYLRTQMAHTKAVSTANVMDLKIENPVYIVFTSSGANGVGSKGNSRE